MPIYIRIKITAWILLGGLILLWLFHWNGIAASIYLALILLFVEMIYPKWNFFGSAITNVRSLGNCSVAITFDDGPSEWTEKILDVLAQKKVKASFFLLGENVLRNPNVAKRIQQEGHAIGMHAHSHTKLHLKPLSFIRRELDLCESAFQTAQIQHDRIFRFPHGFKNFLGVCELKRRKLHLCAWGRGVWDSKKPGVEHIVREALKLRAGEILLLHDGDGAHPNPDRSQTAAALPLLIDGLRERGFEFVKLSDLS